MITELVDKYTAFKRLEAVKVEAEAIAESFGKPIAEIQEQPCLDYVNYGKITQLKEGEVCVFVDGFPARWITDFEIEEGRKVIGYLCFSGVDHAEYLNNRLVITFDDKIKEYYKLNDLGLFEIDKSSLGTKIRADRNIQN